MNQTVSNTTISKDTLTILIPVFTALQETLDCVASVLESDARGARILLLDDGSPGEVAPALRAAFGDAGTVEIISQGRNLGYTRNVGEGLRRTRTPWVCILNSDTLVPAVWAGPLVETLAGNPVLAGVGPLSNAASYQSVPRVIDAGGADFSVNDGLGHDPASRAHVNRVLRHFAPGLARDLPLLNGFCTVFSRAALEAVGGFDAGTFPEGYGEENDLAVRLKARGYRLQARLDVFVHHQKSRSFGTARRRALSGAGAEALERLYGPHLMPSLDRQLAQDPALSVLRDLIAPYLLAPGEGPLRALTPEAPLVTAAEASGCLVEARGPAVVRVTPQGARMECAGENSGARPGAGPVLSREAGGDLRIALPAGERLALGTRAPLLTALRALALRSHWQPVTLGDWAYAAQGTSDDNAAQALPFGMLFCPGV